MLLTVEEPAEPEENNGLFVLRLGFSFFKCKHLK